MYGIQDVLYYYLVYIRVPRVSTKVRIWHKSGRVRINESWVRINKGRTIRFLWGGVEDFAKKMFAWPPPKKKKCLQLLAKEKKMFSPDVQ